VHISVETSTLQCYSILETKTNPTTHLSAGLVLSFLSSPALHVTHHTKDRGAVGDVLVQVLELNRKLDVFAENVPPHLRKTETTSPFTVANDNHVHLQQRVLHCR
jgi:hypothetical protein